MNKTNDFSKKNIFLSFAFVSCILFTVFSLLFNSFYSIILWPLLPNIGVNLVIFVLSAIISSIFTLVRYKMQKSFDLRYRFMNFVCLFYTSIFILFNISTIFFKDVWNLYTIYIILALSATISLIKLYLSITNYLLKAIIYYLVISVPYFIITLGFAGYGNGNKILIVFSIYTLVFIVSNIIIFLFIIAKKKSENENKTYSKQFK